MDGQLRTYGKCEECRSGYTSDGSGPPVCRCGLAGGRNVHVLISTRTPKGRWWIFCDRTRQSFAHLEALTGMQAWRFAAQALGTIRSEVQAGTFRPENYRGRPPAGFGFAEYGRAWLEDLDARGRKPSYIAACRGYLRNHLEPALGAQDLREIQGPQVRALHRGLQAARSLRSGELLSPHMVANVMGCLRSILNDAHQAGDVAAVPRFPEVTVERAEYHTYAAEETALALAELDPADRPLFELLASTPIRPGEARAALLEDLDLRAGMLHVCRTWSLRELRPRRKSGGAYWCPLAPRVVELLHRMLEVRALEFRRPLRQDEHLFVTPSRRGRPRAQVGRPYPKDLASLWRRACKAAGVEYRTVYPLRHSFGHDALDAGASLDEVRDLMGHADRRMTERYAQRSPEAMRRTLRLVEQHRAGVRDVLEGPA